MTLVRPKDFPAATAVAAGDIFLIDGTTGVRALAATAVPKVAAGKVAVFSNSLTLAGVDGKTLTVSNSLALAGTDGTTQTFPSTSGTVVTSSSVNTVTNAMRAQMAAFTLKGNATSGTANEADIDVTALTSKPVPVSGDIVLIQDSAASNAFKKTTVGALSSAGSVASIAGNTGAFTLSTGLTNVGNDIRLALNSATLQAAATFPAGASTFVMMGLGIAGANSFRITPVYSTRVKFEIYGTISNTVAAGFTNIQMRFADNAVTAAPANGATPTGTLIGSVKQITSVAAGYSSEFHVSAIVTGLTAGHTYWFDVSISPTTGTSTLGGVDGSAMEL